MWLLAVLLDVFSIRKSFERNDLRDVMAAQKCLALVAARSYTSAPNFAARREAESCRDDSSRELLGIACALLLFGLGLCRKKTG